MSVRKNKYHHNTFGKVLFGIFSALLLILLGIVVFNTWEINITFPSEVIRAQYGLPFEDDGVEAEYTGSLLKFYKKPAEVTIDASKVDVNQFGEYVVTYTASYKDVTNTVTRKVIVEDTLGPDIQLTSTPDAYTVYDHAYVEEGFKAIDNYDGDVTDKVISEEKNGIVYYTVTDSNGNTSYAKRKITYDDRIGPVITLGGGEEVTTFNGDEYNDEYTAEDDCDGDVTNKVSIEGSVDTSTNGDYTLTYKVTDAHGNSSEVGRIVHVVDKPKNNTTGIEGPKVIYLTFDDGPWQYTDQLLDVLDKYNAKATFFVTNQYSSYAYCIKEEAERGHTVAIHTYSHNYGTIYSSDTAYWSDFNAMNEIVKEQTGSYTTLFRFPGGSSNTISRNYCSGIMSTLASEASAKGYTYYDWNVSSGDAGETTNTDTVYNNVVNGIQANSNAGYPSVVLQHDIKGFSVDAVERILQWGLANGYSFRGLDENSYTAHHGINN